VRSAPFPPQVPRALAAARHAATRRSPRPTPGTRQLTPTAMTPAGGFRPRRGRPPRPPAASGTACPPRSGPRPRPDAAARTARA